MIINTVSYSLSEITSSGGNKKDTVKYLTAIDGTDIIVNFGARLKKTASFTLINITQTNFLSLTEYLITNAGQKVALRPENAGESLFPDLPYGDITDYYCYIVAPKGLQEEDFSTTDSLYSLNLTVELAGVDDSGAIPNEPGTSTIDVLIQLDTIQADFIQSAEPASGTYVGQRWLDTDDNALHEWDGTDWDTTLYTVAADNSTYGFKDGSFYLAAFSTTVYNGNTYKSGLINAGSIKFPGKNIDINGGPAIERKEGFSFSINNNYNGSKFWAWLITNSIGLFGNTAILGIWESGPTFTALQKGKNINSLFNYKDYKFNIEPYSLSKDSKFPEDVIKDTDSRYSDIQTQFLGKPPYVTYGEHELAALQNISTDVIEIRAERLAPSSTEIDTVASFRAQINFNATPKTEIYIRKTAQAGQNVYTFDSDIITDMANQTYAIVVKTDTKVTSENSGETRKILSVSSPGDYYIFVIDEAFTTSPDEDPGAAPATSDYLVIEIFKQKYQFQIDEQVCGGFGTANGTIFTEVLKLKGIDDSGKEIISLPDSEYIVNDDKNSILLNPRVSPDGSQVSVASPINIGGWVPIRTRQFQDVNDGLTTNKDFNAETSGVDLAPPGSDTNVTGHDFEVCTKNSYTFYAYVESSGAPRGAAYSGQTNPRIGNNLKRWTLVNAHGSLTQAQSLGENSFLHAISIDVIHDAEKEALFNTSTNIKMCLNLNLTSFLKVVGPPDRYIPVPFKMVLRFKKNDGSYLANSDWVHDFEANELGIGTNPINDIDTLGLINVNNFPDGNINTGGFQEGTSTLTEHWDDGIGVVTFLGSDEDFGNGYNTRELAQSSPDDIDGAAYIEIDAVVVARNYAFSNPVIGTHYILDNSAGSVLGYVYGVSTGAADVYAIGSGDIRVITWDGTKFVDAGVPVDGDKRWSTTDNLLYEYDGSSWNLYNGTGAVPNGTIVYYLNGGATVAQLWESVSGTPTRATTEEAAAKDVKYKGRDIFDLSTSPFGSSDEWKDVVAVEFLFVNKSFANQYLTTDPLTQHSYWYFKLDFGFFPGTPELYTQEDVETIDRPLLAPARGQTFSGTFSKAPEDIVTDIMNSDGMYLNQWDTSSITTLMGLSSRADWNWRRQFTTALTTEETLKEILLNLWACAIIDTDDKIKFVSLNPDDYALGSPARTFNDSNILVDTIKSPKFRKTNEVYTEFHLNWDYYIPSEFSAALNKYNNNTVIDSNNGSLQTKELIKISKDIYNIKNSLTLGFRYHYESLPLAEWVAKWMALNVWRFSFKVSIDEIIGTNALALMDWVEVNSSFHTNSENVEGFVTMIKPDIYNAIAEIGVHVYRPPGVFGPLCDNFNDALNTDRDVSGWTDANGKKNDAGSTGRTIGDYTIKDAGSSPRTLSC